MKIQARPALVDKVFYGPVAKNAGWRPHNDQFKKKKYTQQHIVVAHLPIISAYFCAFLLHGKVYYIWVVYLVVIMHLKVIEHLHTILDLMQSNGL